MILQKSFWQDDFVHSLTPQEKHFYLYLLTCSKITECGIYELPMQVATMELGYSQATVKNLLKRFVQYGKVLHNKETMELCLIDWVQYNPVVDADMEQHVLQELKKVKHTDFVYTYLSLCLEEDLDVPLLLQHFDLYSEETGEEYEML